MFTCNKILQEVVLYVLLVASLLICLFVCLFVIFPFCLFVIVCFFLIESFIVLVCSILSFLLPHFWSVLLYVFLSFSRVVFLFLSVFLIESFIVLVCSNKKLTMVNVELSTPLPFLRVCLTVFSGSCCCWYINGTMVWSSLIMVALWAHCSSTEKERRVVQRRWRRWRHGSITPYFIQGGYPYFIQWGYRTSEVDFRIDGKRYICYEMRLLLPKP